jgi:hypothetical protein
MDTHSGKGYALGMTSSEPPGDELRAALRARQELGPDYEPAIVESFLEHIDRSIEARVDEQVGARLSEHAAATDSSGAARTIGIAVGTVFGGFLTTAVISGNMHANGVPAVFLVWIAIAVINVAYAVANRPRPRG